MIASLHYDWLKTNVDAALEARNQKVGDQEKGEFVVVQSEILQDMQKTPFLSSKPHRSIIRFRNTWKGGLPFAGEDSREKDVQAETKARSQVGRPR